MTDNNNPLGSGFDETDENLLTNNEQVESTESTQQTTQAPKRAKSDFEVKKQNFTAVFGSGAGKISLIAFGIFILLFIGLGIRGLTSEKEVARSNSEVQQPGAPDPRLDNSAITPEEAQRRRDAAAAEATNAAQSGQTYQPSFDPNIAANQTQNNTGTAEFNINGDPIQQPVQTQQVQAGQGNNDQQQRALMEQQKAQQAAEQKLRQQELAEHEKQIQERDKYVESQRQAVLGQVARFIDDQKAPQGYTKIHYSAQNGSGNGNGDGSDGSAQYIPATTIKINGTDKNSTSNNSGSSGSQDARALIKTGSVLYAQLDSEVNTDDGKDVMATIYGGEWNGSKLIGKVEISSGNIRLHFTKLAPQDSRPVMSIDAIALRSADAKQGMAESINKHTVSRYSSLLFASALSGLGQAASIQTGTITTLNNGTTTQTEDDVSNKRITGMVLGKMGDAAAAEIQQGFNRPITYRIPVNQGMAIYFLSDVNK